MNPSTIEPAELQRPTTPGRKLRFSLKAVLVVTAAVAAALGFFVQQRRLAELQAALWRYEAQQIPTSLAANEFRVIARTIVDVSHVKLISYRIESATEHFATIAGGGDSNGTRSMYDERTKLHFSEATVFFDHLQSDHKVKMMAQVGGACGYSVAPAPAKYTLADAVECSELGGVYSRAEEVELFRWDDKPYSLRLKE